MWKNQVLPICLAAVTCGALIFFLFLEVLGLNHFTRTDIFVRVAWIDVVVGLTIYLKTSIDFVLYMGSLMSRHQGWKSRIAIEIGTALGNALGTMLVLVVWTFFKDVRWLLALMILLAALVLFSLAEEGLEHAEEQRATLPRWAQRQITRMEKSLVRLNKLFAPILRYIIPKTTLRDGNDLPFWPLFTLALTVPFVLGLDGFAGYVPLFNVVNVLGFGIGVFIGHMLLNILLYLSPDRTTSVIRHPVIAVAGSLVFVGLGLWGIVEVVKLSLGS